MPSTENDALLLSGELNTILSHSSHVECKKQVLAFAHMYRKKLKEMGVDSHLLEQGLKLAWAEFSPACAATNHECMQLVQEAVHTMLHAGDRGRDFIGRMTTHYCFERPGVSARVWPEDSEQDVEARRLFLPGVVPRPLLGYFLVSIRGAVDGIDSFKSLPVLFGTAGEDIGQWEEAATAIAGDYRISDHENAPVHWRIFFKDNRTRELAEEILTLTARRMDEMGLDQYLRVLENLQHKRRKTAGQTAMERPFALDDVAGLRQAVDEALEAL